MSVNSVHLKKIDTIGSNALLRHIRQDISNRYIYLIIRTGACTYTRIHTRKEKLGHFDLSSCPVS